MMTGGLRLNELMRAFEVTLLESALTESNGVRHLAAKRLGIGRTTFIEKCVKNGIFTRTPGRRLNETPCERKNLVNPELIAVVDAYWKTRSAELAQVRSVLK